MTNNDGGSRSSRTCCVAGSGCRALCVLDLLKAHRPYGPVTILTLHMRKSRLRGFKLLAGIMQPVSGRVEMREPSSDSESLFWSLYLSDVGQKLVTR